MTLIRIPKSWQLPESKVTSQSSYTNRRRFLKTLVGASIGASLIPLTGCQQEKTKAVSPEYTSLEVTTNRNFAKVDRPITDELLSSRYNNFYEFGGDKSIWQAAQKLPTDPWQVEVSGLVSNPRTYDLDDLTTKFPLEERIYRFRCVEAWSMVLPWIGFPMRLIMEDVEPTAKAKFVRFTSFYDSQITTGPAFHLGSLPWPYRESLRIEEMANDLAFFAVGIYGHILPKQHGAPIRMVVPWKYGFKGAKSIVKIEFLEEQPATYWNTLVPSEYDFIANVNPDIPHPRWSQATEKFIGAGPNFSWELMETLPYNGYAEYVSSIYS